MSGSAAFPTMVILVARAFVTVGSERSYDSVPGVHSSVCHTHSFEKLLISQRSLEEAVGTNGMFLC